MMPTEKCPHVASCALYPQFSLQATLRFWQLKYCEGIFSACARYQSVGRGEVVPITLLPNGRRLGERG
jgi:hypothetical protein